MNTLKPFAPNPPFVYLLKASQNRKVFGCFQGVEKGCIGNEWVKQQDFGATTYQKKFKKSAVSV